jgi:hypothetical protein
MPHAVTSATKKSSFTAEASANLNASTSNSNITCDHCISQLASVINVQSKSSQAESGAIMK